VHGMSVTCPGRVTRRRNHGETRGRVLAACNEALHAAALAQLSPPEGSSAGCVIKPHLQRLTPYLPPLDGRSANQHLLLDFNERTVPPPPHVTSAITAHVASGTTQQYPQYGDINERIAAYAGVPPSQCMFTNGSDQGIDLIVRCCCPGGTEAIVPAPTFAMYEQAAGAEDLVIKRPWFTREAGFPTAEVLAAVSPATSLIVLSNPNNPTGTAIPTADMVTIAEAAPHAAVLVDECYYEFMPPGSSMAAEVGRLRNLFVTRTFSKTWGLPSLRIGYILSAEENINALCCVRGRPRATVARVCEPSHPLAWRQVRGPYDINQLAVVALRAALDDPQYVSDFVAEHNNKARPALEDFLAEAGVAFWPSAANYVFCYFPDPTATEKALRAEGILVRPKKDASGTLGLRVSIGTLAQTERLIATLRRFL